MLNNQKVKGLSTIALVLLISGAIDSIRNLPATALFGSSLICFFIIAAILFLIPTALVSAELAANAEDKGGIFHWVHLAFGKNVALLAIWLQWVNTLVWFPTILSFIVGTATYMIDPALAQNKVFLITIVLSLFWLLTLINLKGIKFTAKFTSVCASIGMIAPMAMIITMAAIWVIKGNPMQVHFTWGDILPSFNNSDNWVSLTAIMAAFLGMELATVHIKDVHNPKKTFPRALLLSVVLILSTMILGSLAIAIVLPHDQINLVNGVMQAFTNFFAAYHIQGFVPVITVMLLMGSFGGILSWIISPIKGLMHAAELGFLPAFFVKRNRHDIPATLLVAQACIVSIVCLAFLFMPSVSSSYWLLTALSTELYILMYVMMFIAAIHLKYKLTPRPDAFTIPGGKIGMWVVSLVGIGGCIITLIAGFIPPAGMDVGGFAHYEAMFTGGMIGMICPVTLFYLYKFLRTRGTLLNLRRAVDYGAFRTVLPSAFTTWVKRWITALRT